MNDNIVDLHPNSKPHVSTLGDRLDEVIKDFCKQSKKQGVKVTFAEIIGTLEAVKTDYIDQMLNR